MPRATNRSSSAAESAADNGDTQNSGNLGSGSARAAPRLRGPGRARGAWRGVANASAATSGRVPASRSRVTRSRSGTSASPEATESTDPVATATGAAPPTPVELSAVLASVSANEYNQALAAELLELAEVYESGFASAYEPSLFQQFDERDLRRAQSLRYAAWRVRQLPENCGILVLDEASLAQVLFEGQWIAFAKEPHLPVSQNGVPVHIDVHHAEAAAAAATGLDTEDATYLKLFQRVPMTRVIFFDVLPAVREFALLWGSGIARGRAPENLLELRTFRDESAAQALTLFHCVWHAKRIRAMQWYHAGCKTLEEVASRCRLTDKRFQLGILYYDDFRLLVPYGEVAAITSIFASASTEIDADLSVIPVGALRRNYQECGDVDLIVTGEPETLHPDGERYGSLKALIKLLRERHFITDEAVSIEVAMQRLQRIRESEAYMAAHMGLLPDERTKPYVRPDWAGIIQAPGYPSGPDGNRHSDSCTDAAYNLPALGGAMVQTAPSWAGVDLLSSSLPAAESMAGVTASVSEESTVLMATAAKSQSPLPYWWATHLHDDELDMEDEVTWSGVVRLAGKPHRRVDIYVVEKDELPWALICYTGSRAFVNALLRHARQKGLYLSARGVRKLGHALGPGSGGFVALEGPAMHKERSSDAGSRAASTAMDCSDTRVEVDPMERFRNVHSERAAFEALGLRYREPTERESADDLIVAHEIPEVS